jgi:regulator of protease activity HflC (stomatin/prohibitin superfamily)
MSRGNSHNFTQKIRYHRFLGRIMDQDEISIELQKGLTIMTNEKYQGRFSGLASHKLLIGALIGVVLFSAIFFPSSISKVDTTEVAIRKNNFTGKTDLDTKYEAGLHWIGFAYGLIKFPKTIQTITYNPSYTATDAQLTSRTKDGLAIALDVSFQYKLRLSDLSDLYMNYEKDYEPTIVRVSRSVLRDVVANYTAIEFFTDRESIGIAMEEALRIECTSVFIDIIMLQLTRIDLPDSFEQTLEEVEVARQQYEIALHDQAAELVVAETQILLAQKQANQTLIVAQGQADALIIEMNAYAESLNITITADAEMLEYLALTLGLNGTELLSYLWIQAITEHTDALLIIGQTTPEILVTQ